MIRKGHVRFGGGPSGKGPAQLAPRPTAYPARVPDEAASVEIPHGLLGFLETGTDLAAILRDTGAATYRLTGIPVTDGEALAQMDLPAHETCVEVGKATRVAH